MKRKKTSDQEIDRLKFEVSQEMGLHKKPKSYENEKDIKK